MEGGLWLEHIVFRPEQMNLKEQSVREQTYYHGKDAIRRQLAFSLGGIPMNLPWILVSYYLMYFLTDIALVPTLVVSALFLGVRAFDAINDPIIGLMSDNTKSRWGRYRPWMLGGAIILVPSVIMLFWAHPNWSVSARIWYTCILYCVAVVGATMWDIPYGALNSCITPFPGERARFASSRILVSSIACAVGSGVFLPLITKFGGASGDIVGGYAKATLLICICALPFAFITFFGTKEVIYPPKGQKIRPGKLARVILQNPPLLIILVGFFVYGFMNYGRGTVAMYYFTYNWDNSNMFAVYNLVNGILSGVAAFFGAYLMKLFKNKKSTCIFGYGILAISCVILIFLNPGNSTMTVALLLLWLGGMANGLVTGMIYGMIPDTVEYGQWKTGIRTDGFIYASTSFMNKMGGAAGPALLGVLLNFAGYVPNTHQTAKSLNMINSCMNLMPAIMAVIAIICLMFYKLDSKTHAKILAELEDKAKQPEA